MLPSEERELVRLVQEKLDNYKKRAFVLEKQWWLNLAFFLGYQWVKYSEIERRLVDRRPREKARVRLTANHILSLTLSLLAKMTANEPAMQVIPNTSSEEDKQAARLGSQAIKWLWKKIEMADVIEELTLGSLIFGMNFLKVYWDPLAEEAFTVEAFDELGNPITQEIHLGQVASDVVPPFALAIDPLAKSFKQAKWVVQSSIRSVEEIEERTGIKVKPEKQVPSFETKLLTLYNSFGASEPISELEGGASWKEYWEIPSSKHRKGRLVIIAGDQLAYAGENPYGRLPYFDFPLIKIPQRVMGKSLIDDLIALNKAYNRALSQLLENANKMAKGKWTTPKDSVSKSALTDETGEIIEFRPIGGFRPEQVAISPLPNYVLFLLDRYIRDMEDVAGIHEISRARPPGGVRAGVALAFLREADDTRIGPIVRRFDSALEKVASFMLQLVGENYTEERLIRLMGEEQAVEVRTFKGADLKNNYDVIVEAGSALAESKIGKQQLLFDLWDRRIITDPQEILKRLEFGEIGADINKDIWKAQAENAAMAQGQVFQPMDYEYHQAHIETHINFMRSPAFYALDQQTQNNFYAHIQTHQQFMAEAARPQVTPEQLAEIPAELVGAPPTPPVPFEGVME